MACRGPRRAIPKPPSDPRQSCHWAVAWIRTTSRPHTHRRPVDLSYSGNGSSHVTTVSCKSGRSAAVAGGASSIAAPLKLGHLHIQTPLALAPMAGITSAPFRLLCAKHGAELCVSELIIASTLLQRTPAALQLARWAPGMKSVSADICISKLVTY